MPLSLNAGQTLTVFPPNVGAQNGERNVFISCNVTGLQPNYAIELTYFPAWKTTGFLIYSTLTNTNYDQTNFTVSSMTPVTGTQSIELTINTAYPALATQYKCHIAPFINVEATFDVVVLGTVLM